MIQCSLFLVLFGLRFQSIRNGDDSVDVVSAYFKIISFHLFVSVCGSVFVVLEPTFILFLLIVVSHMYACENKIGIVFEIGV